LICVGKTNAELLLVAAGLSFVLAAGCACRQNSNTLEVLNAAKSDAIKDGAQLRFVVETTA
jgi:hypothetical protein